MIQPARLALLNQAPVRRGRYVLYWMQASQRSRFNHALEYAIARGNELGLPVVVGFGLTGDYPEANLRHYAFMLQGLADVWRDLRRRGLLLVVRRGHPPEVAAGLAREAAEVVCDRGYLRHQRRWRDELADALGARLTQVESDVVVPVQVVSDKAEYAARTIRPKIMKRLEAYLRPLAAVRVKHPSLELNLRGDVDVCDVSGELARLKVDRTVPPSRRFSGGQDEARRRLREFVARSLSGYARGRNDASILGTSFLSPYLHFGQISPLEIALAVRDAAADQQDADALIEQLVVRRELAINYVQFTPAYDRYEGLPAWARRALAQAATDRREVEVAYTRGQLEAAATHDLWWNAAMREMTRSGFMHNMLRMYWGKRVLQWKVSPQEAFDDLLYLNNRYFLDGRDPNSYAGVAWCFGLHDRPWPRKPIFGAVRSMTVAGLQRKFDVDAYVRFVDHLPEA